MGATRDGIIATLWQGADPFSDANSVLGDVALPAHAELSTLVSEAVISQLPRMVIDVGGEYSAVQIARLFHEQDHDGVVIAVDTWLGSWRHWCERGGLQALRLESGRPMLQPAFMECVRRQGLERYIVPLPLDNLNALVVLARARLTVDLLHLNVSLPSFGVESLLRQWWPLLRPGGCLIAHGHRRHPTHTCLQVSETIQIFGDEHAAPIQVTEDAVRIDKPAESSATTHLGRDLLKTLPEPPRTLDFEGEFSMELILFLPYITWLSKAGLLRRTRVVIYAGMRCFYDDVDCLELVEKHSLRRHLPEERRLASLPVKSEHAYDVGERSPFHLYPDLRRKFGALPLAPALADSTKPLLVLHNKFAVEWNRAPVNHFTLDLLDSLFAILAREFTVVYVRHGMSPEPRGYSKDDNFSLPFDDRTVLKGHPDVLCFDDLYAEHVAAGGTQDVNTFKNVLYSRCYHFLSSQGGGAAHIAFFSGSLLMILHRYGREERHTYGDGFYGFVANPAPIRVICLNDHELLRGVRVFQHPCVVDRRALVVKELQPLLHELSPWTLEYRRGGKWSR